MTALGRHFDRVMQRVQQQLEYLVEQSQIVTMHVYDLDGNLVDNADAEIARYQEIMRQIDELELDFGRIAHIRDVVREFRYRAEEMERELDHCARARGGTAAQSAGYWASVSPRVTWTSQQTYDRPRRPARFTIAPQPTVAPVSSGPEVTNRAQEDVAVEPSMSRPKLERTRKLTDEEDLSKSAMDDEISSVFNDIQFFREEPGGDFEDTEADDEDHGHGCSQAEIDSTVSGVHIETSNVDPDSTDRSPTSSESSSPGSSSSWITFRKQQAVDRAMRWFVRWLDSRIAIYDHQHSPPKDHNGPTGSSTQAQGSLPSTKQRCSSHSTKRTQNKRQTGGAEDEGEEDEESSRKRSKKPRIDDVPSKKLACPYFKRDSKQYRFWRSCPGPGWDTVHRVK